MLGRPKLSLPDARAGLLSELSKAGFLIALEDCCPDAGKALDGLLKTELPQDWILNTTMAGAGAAVCHVNGQAAVVQNGLFCVTPLGGCVSTGQINSCFLPKFGHCAGSFTST